MYCIVWAPRQDRVYEKNCMQTCTNRGTRLDNWKIISHIEPPKNSPRFIQIQYGN